MPNGLLFLSVWSAIIDQRKAADPHALPHKGETLPLLPLPPVLQAQQHAQGSPVYAHQGVAVQVWRMRQILSGGQQANGAPHLRLRKQGGGGGRSGGRAAGRRRVSGGGGAYDAKHPPPVIVEIL